MTISRRVRERAIKRAIDIIGALVLLLALAPSMLGIAMLVRLRSGKPILYREQRVGRGGKPFTLFKFRTLDEGSASARSIAPEDDPRITMVGLPLRRTRLDELPQLYNVLVGDMSLVGPRPHALGSQAGNKLFWEIDMRYWQRHSLRPGMSGLAQVRGYRGATDHESDLVDRLQSDLEYLEGWTILRDIKIILLTLRVMMHDRAY